mmetsp:Transcript_37058/g.104622  ORF Transcript_37058/g.104622 Transcript_37058/m.104622 type:complete len:259 (-) Transcript_37058:268-1044(-)
MQKTQWERPAEGYVGVDGTPQYPSAAQPLPADRRAGWCYVDAYGFQQGPFTGEQLRNWASAAQLPLETNCWFQDGGDEQRGSPVVVEVRSLLAGSRPLCPTGTPAVRGTDAADHEAAGNGSSYSEYASAVLAGLPEDDDAVKIARLAAASNQSLEQVIQFSHAAGSTSHGDASDAPIATAVYNPRTGRIERLAPGGEPSGLYTGMESWVDTNQLEESLQAMQERKGKKLPPEVWKKLKAKRQETKEKLRRQESAWLYQ